MKEIGGYFELELPSKKTNMFEGGVLLSSGRNALEYVLRARPQTKIVWIPYFTCKVVRDIIENLGLEIKWYSIDKRLELSKIPTLEIGEVLLYTNYYGIKDGYVTSLYKTIGDQLIIDNAQALYMKPFPNCHTYYSPRKFMGLPDGGIAFSKYSIPIQIEDVSFDRMSHLLKRVDLGASAGYDDFKQNSKKLQNVSLSSMSKLTKALLGSVDIGLIKKQRIANFKYLHEHLKDINKFHVPDIDSFACPLIYPLLIYSDDLKRILIEKKVYVATYWPNVFDWCDASSVEYQFAKYMVCLPIDQRYNSTDMEYIVQIIKKV